MVVLQRVVKPRNQRSKRALVAREPQLLEPDKHMVFLKGINCPARLTACMRDIVAVKKPLATFYGQKNDVRPFEDIVPLENFTKQHHAPLFAFGSGTKKRPNNLVIGRMYDFHILDMVEFGVENYKGLSDFKSKLGKPALGTKPMVVFAGDDWGRDPALGRIRNLLLDIFRGPAANSVRLQGLESAIVMSVVEGKILFRHYRVVFKKSGTKVPRVELEEIGPRFDLAVRRSRLASDELFKLACKKPKELKIKKKKNLSKDPFGSTLGRVHMTKQNLDELQTRKLKGLKRKPSNAGEKGAKIPAKKKKKQVDARVAMDTS